MNLIGEYQKLAKTVYNGLAFNWELPAYHLYRKFAFERDRLKQSLTGQNNHLRLKNMEVPDNAVAECLKNPDVSELREELLGQEGKVKAQEDKLYEKALAIDKTLKKPSQSNPYQDVKKMLSG